MDVRYRNFYAQHVLSIRNLSEQRDPRAAIIIRGRVIVGYAFSKSTGTGYDTSAITEALINSYNYKLEGNDIAILFCTYFPTLEEICVLFLTDIRTIYYMGDIIDERVVHFLNTCTGYSFEIIKLEFD